jgi:hypothetical protein
MSRAHGIRGRIQPLPRVLGDEALDLHLKESKSAGARAHAKRGAALDLSKSGFQPKAKSSNADAKKTSQNSLQQQSTEFDAKYGPDQGALAAQLMVGQQGPHQEGLEELEQSGHFQALEGHPESINAELEAATEQAKGARKAREKKKERQRGKSKLLQLTKFVRDQMRSEIEG